MNKLAEGATVRPGLPLPMGTYESEGGVNFSFFSRHATRVQLEFFDLPQDAKASRIVNLNPACNHTGDMWHIWVQGVKSGQLYGYRVDGPYQPTEGHRFNVHKLLIDPFANAISQLPDWNFERAHGFDPLAPKQDAVCSQADDAGSMPKSIFTDNSFDWQNDQPLKHPWSKTVIYETHVRGFTMHASSGVKHAGTYRVSSKRYRTFKTWA